MKRLIVRRVLTAAPMLLLATAFIFILVDLAPGDPAYRLAGENPTPERIETVREELRLDDPLPQRYVRWLTDAIQGDFGSSFSTPQSVTDVIGERLGSTFSLILVSLVGSCVFGSVLGVVAALQPNGVVDRVVTVFSSLLIAVPQFWLGMVLVLVFAVNLGWFPAVGYAPPDEGLMTWLRHLILPGIALSTVALGELALQTKAALVEVMGSGYILAAEAKGLTRRSIVGKHALKNSAIPVVTVLGYRIAQIIGGTVVIEAVFAIQGVGTLAISSVLARDVPVLLGLVMLTTALVLAINVLVDISYGYFNPKAVT